MIKVNIKEGYFWQKYILKDVSIWFKGYIHNKTSEQILTRFHVKVNYDFHKMKFKINKLKGKYKYGVIKC